jgi:hypothetical protein
MLRKAYYYIGVQSVSGGWETALAIRGRSSGRGVHKCLHVHVVHPLSMLPQIVQMKNDISRRAEKAKMQDLKYRQSPDIVVNVVCRYRAELFFKISRKTKLVKLFAAWSDRMETGGSGGGGGGGKKAGEPTRTSSRLVNGVVPGASLASPSSAGSGTNFIFTHSGRQVDAEQTPEEAGMEDGDEILAVELMDLTEGPSVDASVSAEKQT